MSYRPKLYGRLVYSYTYLGTYEEAGTQAGTILQIIAVTLNLQYLTLIPGTQWVLQKFPLVYGLVYWSALNTLHRPTQGNRI
jgi:hypothetical protein